MKRNDFEEKEKNLENKLKKNQERQIKNLKTCVNLTKELDFKH